MLLAFAALVVYVMYVMNANGKNAKRVYVQATAAHNRRLSRSVTLPGWTPARAIRELVKAYRRAEAERAKQSEPAESAPAT